MSLLNGFLSEGLPGHYTSVTKKEILDPQAFIPKPGTQCHKHALNVFDALGGCRESTSALEDFSIT